MTNPAMAVSSVTDATSQPPATLPRTKVSPVRARGWLVRSAWAILDQGFFALSNFLDRFRLLHYGLAAILAFVALKMLTVEFITVPVGISLGIILLILAIFIVLSLKMPQKPPVTKGV